MRQQYHFRNIEGKMFIWNVNKIIAENKHLPIQSILVSEIREVDEPYWFEQSDHVTVRDFINHIQLINEASLDYPIVLCSEGRIIDGMHRVVKAVLLQQTHIKAIQLLHPLAPDYIDVDPETLPYDEEAL